MVHTKNYETACIFVKVVQKKLWPLFSGHGVVVENGYYRCPKRRQFVTFLATVVVGIVAKNGIVDEAEVFKNFE